jgi:hypothetical protein
MKVLTKKDNSPAKATNKLSKGVQQIMAYVGGKLEGCSAGCKGAGMS